MTNEPYVTENKPAGKGNGIASLVCGIISCLCCSFLCIPAIICGIISIVQTKNAGSKVSGLAIAGLILGVIAIAIWIYNIVVTGPSLMNTYSELLANMDM